MDELRFAYLATTKTIEQAKLLTRSIRESAGKYASSSVMAMVPEPSTGTVSDFLPLIELDASVEPFEIESGQLEFPFAAKVAAAAHAEAMASGQVKQLVWLDVDSIIIREPSAFRLAAGTNLAYRPVDHTLIGSSMDQPADRFWQLIYENCDVSEDRIFPLTTSVDQVVIRPYFNAGMLVVRPADGVLQAWWRAFENLYEVPEITAWYDKHVLYRVFVHQAVLAGVILNHFEKDELQELPYRVNYPLHMHEDYPSELRPQTINELISLRYDTYFADNPNWQQELPVEGSLRDWLIQNK